MADQSVKRTLDITTVIRILIDNAPEFSSEEEKERYILEALRKIRDAGITLEINEKTPEKSVVNDYRREIYETIAAGDTKKLEALIEKGADIDMALDANDNTLLHIAAMKGKMECMRILFTAGADPYIRNAEGKNPVELFRSLYPEKYSEYKERIVKLTGIELKETVSLELR